MESHNIHDVILEPIVVRALQEDWGLRDWSTDLCVPSDKIARARIIAKEDLILSGLEVADCCFRRVDPETRLRAFFKNGDRVRSGEVFLEIKGHARSLLKAERVALNFLGRLCGIATLTRSYVKELAGLHAQLLDTRKSTPGLRALEKAAVANGGARNHRLGLSDGVMLKENHIRAAGGISKAMAALLESLPPTIKIEVETTNLTEVQEALDAGADIIMLDNMTLSEMELAVRTIRGRSLVEASGNVTLERLKDIARTGVDFISTGAILHSARWSDISMLFDVDMPDPALPPEKADRSAENAKAAR